jgi:translation initiation factor 2 alpha subunit (eIF-2alpha)
MEIEEGDLVLCTVDRIVGTVVFVKIDALDGKEGSITISEIAPGRIRNLRDYVVPKKKIVCKVLRLDREGHIGLTLRRVTLKEKKEVLEQEKQEKSFTSLLKSVLGQEKSEQILEKIKKESKISEFVEDAREDPGKIEALVSKADAKKILDAVKAQAQKKKKAVIKKTLLVKTAEPNGVTLIKAILGSDAKTDETEISYISAGKYAVKLESDDIKKADAKLQQSLDAMKTQAQKQKVEFEVKAK